MMARKRSVLLFIVSLLVLCVAKESDSSKAISNSEECALLGFNSDALDCKTCAQLNKFIQDLTSSKKKKEKVQELINDCKKCCTSLEDIIVGSKIQYEKAVLEVCTCKFGKYPKVANFVNNHVSEHSRLEVKYMNARHPHLIFYDEAGEKQEEVSIGSWNEETIKEFLLAKLKEGSPSKEKET